MAMTSAPPDAKFGEHRTDPGGPPMKHRALGTTTPSDDEAGHLRWRPDPAGGVTARSPIRTPMSGLAVPSGHHGPADAWFGSRRRLHPWAFPVDPCPIPGGEQVG